MYANLNCVFGNKCKAVAKFSVNFRDLDELEKLSAMTNDKLEIGVFGIHEVDVEVLDYCDTPIYPVIQRAGFVEPIVDGCVELRNNYAPADWVELPFVTACFQWAVNQG